MNLILKLHKKESSYLVEGMFFIGILKVGDVPRMRIKEALALFIYKLYSELKTYLPRKILKIITVCILKKRECVQAQLLLTNC